MKFSFTADGHIGNYGKEGGPVTAGINERCRHSIGAFRFSVLLAKQLECRAYTHLGDLFDYQRMEPQVVAEVQDVMDDRSLEFVGLVGNHDQRSTDPGDHAMAPLRPVCTLVDAAPNWFVYRDGDESCAMLVIPFQAGRAEDWLPQVIRDHVSRAGLPEAKTRVLCFHLGISDSRTPYYLDGAHDSVCLGTVEKLAAEFGFTHVFAGNWHCWKHWTVEGKDGAEVEVVQVGSLAPNRFSDSVDDQTRNGTMAVLDTETGVVKTYDIPGPRFIKVAGLDAVEALTSGATHGDVIELAAPLYVSAIVDPEDADHADELLTEFQSAISVLRHFEVHLDTSKEDAATEAAISTAVAATSHQEAIRIFAEGVPIPPTVDRGDVTRFVDECLKEAKSC